ncbi:accessory Sec system translocase SecA2 [Schlesneria paludicola]|uniref:accessory Sec system translocase SecA2 n=1 Tax=Schlesneria paludicola TaxID=360056 RepID=UPI00029A0230|nr:accessory Sec system translocase SecA2 [Schlesneria paludicola]
MIASFFRKVVTGLRRLSGQAIEISLSSARHRCEQIQRRIEELSPLRDDELQKRVVDVRARTQSGATLNDVLVEMFALVSVAARRTLHVTPFDVQLLAGLAIHEGKIAQMQTGEGKTLAAVFPACLNALLGRGVHVLTFNDYLAERDANWMRPIYEWLGLSVACVVSRMTPSERRAAYQCDVTYSTAKEAGFDFLRDQLAASPDRHVQRGHFYAIVDEADSLLIDQGRIPMVIATRSSSHADDLYHYADLVRRLRPRIDYGTDSAWRNVSYNPPGLNRLRRELGCGELHTEENANLLARLNLALHAEVLMRRDVDYLVRAGRIELVDELTGRVVENRRWPWGLQAAIEAKEKLEIQPQGKILNSITLQHFLKLYARIGGMTATAEEAAHELHEFYDTRIVIIPPNRPCRRQDFSDWIFVTQRQKFAAIVDEIDSAHRRRRPVLVGTASVAESEYLAEQLIRRGIACNVLNAKNDEREAELIAEAGALGAVTISTNMAGRGTDIRLGGHDESDHPAVVELGGLFVIGTSRNESRRIDNQLRGRAGRQGDPGDTRFFVSFEDELLVHHGLTEDDAGLARSDAGAENRAAGERIAHIQRVVEGANLEIHRTLRKYSHLVEQQRRTVQDYRLLVMRGVDEVNPLRLSEDGFFQNRVARFGQAAVDKIERQVTLQAIDDCWSDYLERVAEIRDGIHLVSMGGFDPLVVYNDELASAFRTFFKRVEAKSSLAFREFFQHRETLSDHDEATNGSSTTWTYMVNDNPMGDLFERIRRNVKQAIYR